MTSKEQFFKNHNLMFIDKDTTPNWEDEKYKYFVIEHSKDFRYVITSVYTQKPFKIKAILLYVEGKPYKEFTSFEAAYTLYKLLSKGEKLK